MRFLPLALLLLSACKSPSAAPRAEGLTPQEILIASKPSTDPSQLKAGQWILLSVSLDGTSSSRTTKIQVTGEDAAGLWIEQKVDTSPRPLVFKSKIGRDGTLLEGWVGEAGSPSPAKVYPRADGMKEPASPAPVVRTEASAEAVTVRGKSYACTKLVSTIVHSDGRRTIVTEWCSPEVPFSAMKDGQPVGGLVRREIDRYRVELVDHGMGAQEELRIPR